MRSANTANQSWEFTVQSNVSGAPVTLTWPALATVPGKTGLMLTDLDNKTTINLRSRSSYVINPGQGSVQRRFLLELKRAERSKLQISELITQVNSSSAGGRAASGVSISYRLSSAANVQVTILQGGRKIRTLDPNRSRAAGVADATWDLKSDNGTSVAGGLYTVEVRATDDQGNVVRQSRPALITR